MSMYITTIMDDENVISIVRACMSHYNIIKTIISNEYLETCRAIQT